MRRFGSVRSSCHVSTASFALRSGLREGDSHRFFASCCVMVDAPRGISWCSIARSTAWRHSVGSKPLWLKKRMSSATSTARLRCEEIVP